MGSQSSSKNSNRYNKYLNEMLKFIFLKILDQLDDGDDPPIVALCRFERQQVLQRWKQGDSQRFRLHGSER
jgi:hypothetical protein